MTEARTAGWGCEKEKADTKQEHNALSRITRDTLSCHVGEDKTHLPSMDSLRTREPGIHLRNTRSCTDCNPEAKGVCTSHRSSHSEWLRQARTRSTRSGPCYCAHCSHTLGNHFLLMWARLSRGLAHISSVAACIQTPVVCVRPPTGVWSLRVPHSLACRDVPLQWLVSTRRPFHSKWIRAVRRPSV